MSFRKSHARSIALSSLLAIAGIAGIAQGSEIESSPDEQQKHAMSMAMDLSMAFEYASETIESSVVHIITESQNRRGFRQRTGLGSGVIADERGYILTNAHVVEAGSIISVRLSDGREMEAELIGTFPETDVAVLRIDAEGLVPAEFGDSEALRVGEWVLAVGSPFGFQQSVTAGIVSAKGRGSMSMSPGEEQPGFQRFQEFIQTDAAINPGNSGGPLVDLHGRVIGINTAILSRSGGNNGLGFAIPIDIAGAVMNRIIENGRVDRGWFGVAMEDLAPVEAYTLGIDGGVVLSRVSEDGPAESAGLQAGDIVVALGGRATENRVRMGNAIMLARPGEPVEVEYYRDGIKRTARARLQDRDKQRVMAFGGAFIEEIGASIIPDEKRWERRGRVIDRIEGFSVFEVQPSSPAELAGLERGDFVYEVDGRSFEDADQLNGFLSTANYDRGVRLKVIRGSARGYIDLKK
ncbi:MAG: trypsin-like peptidase domain-containing protein [Phycisphaerales bacterium]|nr:trypsin-like peptidase domain-containing protein [Phycisphaerales bacterium]